VARLFAQTLAPHAPRSACIRFPETVIVVEASAATA